MIDKGSNVFDGTIIDLKRKYGKIRELNFKIESDIVSTVLDYSEHFMDSGATFDVEVNGRKVKVRFNPELVSVAEVLSYTLKKVNVKDIFVSDLGVEEIIRNIYR